MANKPNRSHMARACLLLEDGTLQDIEGASPARGFVLSRALCRYQYFRAAPNLNRGQIARAARTFAEANNPFPESSSIVLRAPHGAGVWWWDRAQLAALGLEARDISPESVWRAPAGGWRVLACGEGFEAQYWEEGALIASTWRREPFTREQWRAFVLSVPEFSLDAPDDQPTPEILALADASWRGRQIKAPMSWREVEMGAVTVALCGVALAAFFAGQALRHEAFARDAEKELATVEAQGRADPRIASANERAQVLREFAASTSGADALAIAADIFDTLSRYQITPNAWAVNAGTAELTIDAIPGETPIRDIAAALEASPRLCGVTPELAGRDGGVELRARVVRGGERECEPVLRGRAS